jgi:two-component system, OmpR family, response regulator
MKSPRNILLVDPERESRLALAGYLERNDLRVTAVVNGAGMQRVLERTRVDAVVLDVSQDDEEGLRLVRSLRATSEIPLILLARRNDETDRIVGLELGADEFLPRHVNPRELLARLRNVIRRAATAPSTPARSRLYLFGGWQLDVVARELAKPDGDIAKLRSSDFRVLSTLLSHGNRVVTRHRLFELARGREAEPYDRSIDVRISRLRQILGDDARVPRIIKTVHGEGYVIGVPVERA